MGNVPRLWGMCDIHPTKETYKKGATIINLVSDTTEIKKGEYLKEVAPGLYELHTKNAVPEKTVLCPRCKGFMQRLAGKYKCPMCYKG